MTTDTTGQRTGGAQLAAEPIPTDPGGLYDVLRELPPGAQCEVADILGVQLGGTPDAIARACEMVDEALGTIAHEEEIDRERAHFAECIAAARKAVAATQASLATLSGDAMYDVDYAEGGQRVLDLRAFLDDAARMLRAAAAINPCPPETNA